MADYYTQFCVSVGIVDDAEEHRVKMWLSGSPTDADLVPMSDDDDYEHEDVPQFLIEAAKDAELKKWVDVDDPCPGFHISWNTQNAETKPMRFLIIYGEEQGKVEHAALLILMMMRASGVKDVVKFSFAQTCSRSIPDGFGGGHLLIHPDGIETLTYGQMLDREMMLLDQYTGSTRKVEYWRIWPVDGLGVGRWDTDYIDIPTSTPVWRLDETVRESARALEPRQASSPVSVGFFAYVDEKEKADEATDLP